MTINTQVNNYAHAPDRKHDPAAKTSHSIDYDELFANESMPRRSVAPGNDAGLSIMLNVEIDEYYCTGTESVGFKVMLSVSLFRFTYVKSYLLSCDKENFVNQKAYLCGQKGLIVIRIA